MSNLFIPDYMAQPPAWFYHRILVGPGAALTPSFAAKHNIQAVINCADNEACPEWWRRQNPSKYACMDAVDSPFVNILSWYTVFEQTLWSFLRSTTGTVYVHCQAGMNRSASLTLAYVCKNFGLDFDTTVQSTLRQRPCMFKNPVFMNQVKKFVNGHIPSSQNSGHSEWVNNWNAGLGASGNRTGTA